MENRVKILVPVLLSGFLFSSCEMEPVVTLDIDQTGITSYSAIIKGRITKEGKFPATECGFYLGTERGDLKKITIENVATDFSVKLTGLIPQTTYYYKAYASRAGDVGSGRIKKFKTASVPPLWQKTSQSYNWKIWPRDIVFTDSLNIWVNITPRPAEGTPPDLPIEVFRSQDGGNTWTKRKIPGSNKLSSWSFSAIDGKTAWVTIRSLGLFRTVDGGSSWNLLNLDDHFRNHPSVVHFFDSGEGIGYVVHDSLGIEKDSISVIKTHDGGLNWFAVKLYEDGQKISGERTGWLRASISSIGDTVAFGTLFGRIFISCDRGNTWKIVSYPSNPYIDCTRLAMLSANKFAFTSSETVNLGSNGLIANSDFKIVSTIDGGKTWTVFPSISGLFISAIPRSNFYVATTFMEQNNSGKTYLSADAGKSFIEVDTLFTNINVATFYSIFHGLGCSFNGHDNTMPDKTNYIYKWNPEILLTNGTHKIHRDSIFTMPYSRNILISGIRLLKNNGEFWKIKSKSVKLRHDQNSFLLEYEIVNYTGSRNIRYRYMMEGLQNQWIESAGDFAEFMDLKPGKYLFRANPVEQDGSWSKLETKLSITILPPLWKRLWFTGGIVFVSVLLLYIFIRYRERNLRKRNIWLEGQVKEKTDLALSQRIEFEKMKSNFYTNISHDFRTPLTLINNSAKEIETISDDKRVSKFTGTIFKSSARLLKLVNELLDLSKAEAGKLELKISEGNLSSEAKFIWQTYISDAERRGLKYLYSCEPESIVCWYDSEFISKILHNLISNALKFTPREGEVVVSIELISGNSAASAIEVPAPYVIIRVKDTGKGISEDNVSRIFERFYQADSSGTREQEGTGIGLSIVHEMVKRHHGEIVVDSAIGQGSEFAVFIPVAKGHYTSEEISYEKISAAKIPVIESPENVSKNETTPFGLKFRKLSVDKPLVLVVEDNDDLREFLCSQMSKAYRVEEAVNGKEAIEKAHNLQPAIIISDIMMPVMDGVAMCADIKNNPVTCHIPVILLTAKADIESRLEGLRTGADDYLTKPFNDEELAIRTDNLLRQRQIFRDKFLSCPVADIQVIHKGSGNEEFMKELINHIESNLIRSDLSTEKLASAMNLGSRTLLRKIETLTGMTPTEFIRIIRIKHAAALISDKKVSVTEAAYATGFTSLSYFTRTFKAVTGVSPSEYLK